MFYITLHDDRSDDFLGMGGGIFMDTSTHGAKHHHHHHDHHHGQKKSVEMTDMKPICSTRNLNIEANNKMLH